MSFNDVSVRKKKHCEKKQNTGVAIWTVQTM